MKIGVTGHRPKDLGNEYNGKGPFSNFIRKEFRKIFEIHQPETFINGLAEGVDMITAELAIEMGIHILACAPFEGQKLKWSNESQERYNRIIESPLTTLIIVSSVEPTTHWEVAAMMQKRNEYMVDELEQVPEAPHLSDFLVSVWNGKESGGTWNCIKYARKKLTKEQFLYINPNDALK